MHDKNNMVCSKCTLLFGGKVVFEWESGVLFFAALSWFVLA